MELEEIRFTSLWDKLAVLCLVNLFSYYCFYLSGILYVESTSLFFDPELADIATISSLLTFVLGMILRPFGALFLGLYGDSRGVKKSLVTGLMIMSVSTVLIGLMPSFKQIGGIASFLNVILRLAQGFALGGIYACAAVLSYEIAPPNRKGQYTSMIQISVPCGFLASIAVVILLKLFLGIDKFLAWGWRGCFLVAVFLFIAAWRLRRSEIVPHENENRIPSEGYGWELKKFISDKKQSKNFFFFILPLMVGLGLVGYVSNPYKLYFLQTAMRLESETVSFNIAISSVLFVPTYIYWGYLADRMSKEKLLMYGLLLALLLVAPLYFLLAKWIQMHQALSGKIGTQTIVAVLLSAMISAVAIIGYGPMIAYVCEKVPARLRCTAMAISYNLGFGIFAGIVHLMSNYYFQQYQWVFAGVAVMEVFGIFVFAIALLNRPGKPT